MLWFLSMFCARSSCVTWMPARGFAALIYPIRVGNYGLYKAVNYHRWDVCKAAILLGQKENLPVYKFLKEPLIRKFGEDWYAELELVVEEMKKQGIL